MAQKKLNRRTFLTHSAAAATAFSILPAARLKAQDRELPDDAIRIAGVGCGGQAMHDLGQVSYEGRITALADVDWDRGGKAFIRWPDAKKYQDYREMLEVEKDNYDAVVVACPDHNHAPAAMQAMKLGKHVYVEKPMAHTIHEVRALSEMAAKQGVVTQMGNQGHSLRGCHEAKAWVEDGFLEEVTEVLCWTNRPRWPQGIPRPEETPPVPEKLDWDLWLGPAPERPYHPAYCPRNWRGWYDFGTGSLGDMGCHIMDLSFFALNLGSPARVAPVKTSKWFPETYPASSIVEYDFPARNGMPPVKLTWYDGGNMPAFPDAVKNAKRLGDNDGGQMLIGKDNVLVAGTYGNMPKVYSKKKEEQVEEPKITPVRRMHHRDWVQACKNGGDTVSSFDYAAKLTEMVLLGCIALRANQPIEWDGDKMEITNLPDGGKQYLVRNYREGWTL
jgi:predicted dehydrogenase